MRDYPISKEADMRLHEMMLYQEIRMAIESETADLSFLTSPAGKAWMSTTGNGNDGSR